MAVDRSIVEGLGDELARLYGGLELELARGMGQRLARGIDSPDWLQQKLGAVGEVRRWVDGLTSRTNRGLSPKVDRAIRTAFKLGADAADKELAGRVSRRAVQRALPGTSNINRLATQLTGQLQATGPQVVRSALDAYRHVVTQASANVLGGALTRQQAGQQAWNGLLDKGFSGFADIRGRQWSLAGYVDMATRTTTAQAAVSGQLDRQAAAGIDLVIVSNAPQECQRCRPWEGKVLTRDESGRGGKNIEAEHAIDDKMVTVRVAGSVNEAIAAGLQHPNCRHSLSAYLPGLTQVPTGTEDPKGDAARQRLRALERRARGARLQEAGALTPEGKAKAAARLKATQAEIRQHVKDTKDLGIKRKPERERIDLGNARKPLAPVFADVRKADDALSSAPIAVEGKESTARGALSEHELTALKAYRSNEFELVNGALRMGLDEAATLLDEEDVQLLHRTISAMDDAMARSALTGAVGVYRGVKRGGDIFGEAWGKRLTGAEWVEPGYTSTTANEATAGFFRWGTDAATFRIVVPRGTQAIQLSGRGGGGESELLLGRGQRFRVIGDTGPESADSVRGRVIDLEVVTDGA